MKCNSRILFILLLIVMIFSITAVSAAENHTQVKNVADHESVNNMEILGISSNDNIISASDSGRFIDLKNKIDNARPGTVLTLENDYKFTDNVISTGITVSKSLTIDGNGYTIDALNKGRIFNVTSGPVTIKNLTIKNANGNNQGGVIHWSGGSGCVSNCTFLDCKSTQNGGTIYWTGYYGSVADSKFINCNSPNKDAGAIYWNGVNGTVDNCSFIKCSSKFGGAIYWGSYNGSLMNSHFEDCYSTSYGGAVDWVGSNGFIDNCTFKKCYSTDYGGAVYYESLNAEIFNCKFLSCYSKSRSAGAVFWWDDGGLMKNCSFVDCSSISGGGGLYWSGAQGSVTNSSFESCSSTRGGGAIAWDKNKGNVSDCTFVKCFSHATATGGEGGAIYWNNAADSSVENSTFINCSASHNGGAIYWPSARGKVINCIFEGCNAALKKYGGGAIYWSGVGGSVMNSSFVKCHTEIDGGAIYWSADGGSVSDSRFEECFTGWFGNGGGGIYWYAISGSVNNCTFLKCTSEADGAGIYWNSRDGKLQNSTFDSCKADTRGGGLRWSGNNGFTYGCNFINCSSINAGGIYWTGGSGSAFNITMVNCSAKTNGGGLYWSGSSGSVRKSDFEGCSADFGGAAYWTGKNGNVTDSIFMICSAKYGGAIHIYNTNVDVNNSYFENNSAYHSGAINIRASDVVVDNSNFTDNHVSHGGGAIGNYGEYPDKVKAVIRDSKFDNNCANNYGGALSLEYVLVDNSLFNDNSAVFGGAIYSITPEIRNSTFNGCKALELGNDVFAINKSTIVNSNVLSENLYENNLTDSIIMVASGKITYNGYDYDVFAAESNIVSPNGRGNDLYIADSSLKLLRNVVDSSDCSEYLKLILYNYSNNQLSRSEAVAMIRNGVYGNSPVPSEKAPVFEFVGNSVIVYDYISFITPSSNTNYYSVKKTNYILNQSITKVALNKTAFVGDIVEFSINFTNGNNFTLPDVFVKDVFDENEFEYLSFKSNDNWTYNSTSKIFTLSSLNSHNTSNLVLSFKVKTNATLNNTVYGGFKGSITCNNTTSIKTFNPVLNVEKSCLTSNVFLTQTAKFNITVKNNGDIDLHDIVLTEDNSKDLLFEGFYDYGLWDYSLINKKHTWKLRNPLAPGHASSLLVYFNTNASGRLINNVSVESSQTKGKFTAQASVDVIRPEIKVEKIAVNPDVVLSDPAVFKIIVNNTSPVDLTGVSVCEDSYDGLLYDSFRASDSWIHSIIAGKQVWTFKDNLVPGEVISFFTVFNTTSNGTFVNNVVASSDTSSSTQANATVNVLVPKFSVEKVALTQSVVLGSKAVYQIVIHNTGETDLTNIVVEEYPDSSLVYDYFTDNGLFIHSIVNEKHVWTLNRLSKGDYAEFSVYFNTTASGRLVNNVSAESSQTKGKFTAQASVDVIRPEIKVEKIAVNSDVVLSDPAVFEIIVNNTSPVTLTGVSVCEDSYDGLLYDSFRASDSWNHSIIAGKHVWTFTENLLPGEVISFFTVFNTYRNGTFVNNVVVSSDTSSSAQANATVNVLVPKLSVEKVALMQSVSLGSQAVYEIVLHNVGETDLTNIVVEEYPDSSLVYDHFTDNGLFTHSIINEKHVWTLNKLTKGAYAGFLVYFNTTAAGNVTNRISVRSDEIKDTNASNTTNVLLPSFTVEKICLIPNVLVGNQTLFEVAIKNTGKVELTNVYFTEESFDGLIFDSAIGEAIWTHSIVKGKNTWTLNEPLKGDAYIGLILKFNTTAAGNYTNIISAASNQTGVLIANATVHVFENKVPDPPEQNSSNNYSMEVFKIAVTPSVVLNDQITFQIIIHNTGKFNLNNVKVTELIPEGLIYSHFVDYLNIWTYNGDLTWSSNSSIYPGEYVGFYVTFNTTKDGVFTNIVNVAANNTNDSSSNASFNVLKPDFTVEKILVEDNILNGNQATFGIVVHNTGNAPLTGVTVREYDFKGLVYNHFTDYLDIWTYNGDLTWTMNTELLAGEYVALFVTFNTTGEGNFTNIVAADSNECEEKFSNATVRVFNENIDISMICLTPLVIVGNQAIFEITIQNTGKIPISVLKLSEFDFDGLIYDHYIDYLGEWINDGLTWTLNTTLVPREVTSLFVVFNTTKEGNFTNIILANKDVFNTNRLLSANGLEEGIYVSAPVEVVKPVYAIEKVTINRTVIVGEEVMFEIIVHNTCKVNIDNVTVRDIPSDALSYVRFIDNEGRWVKNGDLSWNLTKALVPGEYSSFFVVFNATKAGVFLNSIESGNLTSNASVEVEEIARPEYTIDKVTINRTVNIGEEVMFEIIVHNTGKINIHNIVVRDIAGVGLDYVSFIDDEGCWIKNSDLSWNLTESLVPGEYSSFFVVFNATKAGVLENVIESGNLTSNASVEVEEIPKPENPGLILEAEIISDPVTGKPLLKVTVINNGDVDLSNVFVKINLPEGLNTGDYYSYDSIWTFNKDVSYLEGILKINESKSFYVELIGEPGEYQIPIDAGYNSTVADSAVVFVKILDNSTQGNDTNPVTPADNSSKAMDIIIGRDNSTGNPLIMVLLALICFASATLRKRK